MPKISYVAKMRKFLNDLSPGIKSLDELIPEIPLSLLKIVYRFMVNKLKKYTVIYEDDFPIGEQPNE